MNITMMQKRSVKPTVLKIYCKVRDCFTGQVVAEDGSVIWDQDDGYVPSFMPGDHHGDYVILDIDIHTGRVLNWRSPEDLERRLQECVDEALK